MKQFCRACGERLSPGNLFCEKCGTCVGVATEDTGIYPGILTTSQREPITCIIPFQRAETGPYEGHLCNILPMSAGIVVAGMTPTEEKTMKGLATLIEKTLSNENIEQMEGFWEVAAGGANLFLPPFLVSPPLGPGQRNLIRLIIDRMNFGVPPWSRYGRMDKEEILAEDPKNYFIPYEEISQVTSATCMDDEDGFTLVVGEEEIYWSCQVHTYQMAKAAISSAAYAALSRQAGVGQESHEVVAGVIAGCANVLLCGNYYKFDCIVTPLCLVFIDPCFWSWEEMSKGWFAEAPASMKDQLLSQFEQVTGTRWHGSAEQLVTSAVGDVPGTPWEALRHRPVQVTIDQSVNFLIIPARDITGITITPGVPRAGGLFYMQKIPVDQVLIEIGQEGVCTFDLPPGSAGHAGEVFSKVVPGRVKGG